MIQTDRRAFADLAIGQNTAAEAVALGCVGSLDYSFQ